MKLQLVDEYIFRYNRLLAQIHDENRAISIKNVYAMNYIIKGGTAEHVREEE